MKGGFSKPLVVDPMFRSEIIRYNYFTTRQPIAVSKKNHDLCSNRYFSLRIVFHFIVHYHSIENLWPLRPGLTTQRCTSLVTSFSVFWRVSSIKVYYYTNITQAVKDLVKSCDLMLGLERNKGCTHALCRNMTDS